MKLGKIVELSGVELENGFEVIGGIDVLGDKKEYGFASIIVNGFFSKITRITYMYSYCLRKEYDLFKEYIISNDTDPSQLPSSELNEEFLWVIIPYSAGIETNAKKVAGRYATEAILEMHVGETVTVRKAGGTPETYMIVKAGNELFLVKKNR